MELLVPILFVIATAALTALALALRASLRRRALDVIHRALEVGATLDRDTVTAIVAGQVSAYADLRRGALFIAGTLALVVVSLAVEPRIGGVLRALAAFPGLAGLTYLGFHFARLR